jgi:hypothetical protein
MHAFTLRLEPSLAKKLDLVCKRKGYSKTGLMKSLIRNFIEQETLGTTPPQTTPQPMDGKKKGLAALVGIVSLGGDSVKDKREFAYF